MTSSRRWVGMCLAALLGASCSPEEGLPLEQQSSNLIFGNPTVDPARELLITSVGVVEDPVRTVYLPSVHWGSKGAWTFGRLIEQVAGGQDPSQFVLDWLMQWERDQVINGFTDPARPAIRTVLIDPWLVASGCAAGSTSCDLDFTKAPFRLTAIVNRIDKRAMPDATGRVTDAGEGRFVFNVLNLTTGLPLTWTVIFEYQLPSSNSLTTFLWANLWHSLSLFPVGSAPYNSTLQSITDTFSRSNPANGRPNGSFLNALRTNEVSLAAAGSDPTNPPSTKLWEIRSNFIGNDGRLHQGTVAQTPALSFDGTTVLGDWLNSNAAAVLNGSYQVPTAWLDAASPTPSGLLWTAPGVTDPAVLSAFAVNTCSGCHRSETATSFLHIGKRSTGAEVAVSPWLSTIEVPRRVADFTKLLTVENLQLAGDTKKFRAARGH